MRSLYNTVIFIVLVTVAAHAQTIDVITGLNDPSRLLLDGNDNKISVKDLSNGSNSTTDLVTGLNLPLDIELAGSTLYILENGANKISKVENILGVETQKYTLNHPLFPNPTSDYLEIANVEEVFLSQYTIFWALKFLAGQFYPMKK